MCLKFHVRPNDKILRRKNASQIFIEPFDLFNFMSSPITRDDGRCLELHSSCGGDSNDQDLRHVPRGTPFNLSLFRLGEVRKGETFLTVFISLVWLGARVDETKVALQRANPKNCASREGRDFNWRSSILIYMQLVWCDRLSSKVTKATIPC